METPPPHAVCGSMASNCRAPDGGGDGVRYAYAVASAGRDDADGTRRSGSDDPELYGV